MEGLFNAAVCVYSGGLFELVVYLGVLALVFTGFHRQLECIIIAIMLDCIKTNLLWLRLLHFVLLRD